MGNPKNYGYDCKCGPDPHACSYNRLCMCEPLDNLTCADFSVEPINLWIELIENELDQTICISTEKIDHLEGEKKCEKRK